jgi:hypothetical protein
MLASPVAKLVEDPGVESVGNTVSRNSGPTGFELVDVDVDVDVVDVDVDELLELDDLCGVLESVIPK